MTIYTAHPKVYKIIGSIFKQGDVSIRVGCMVEPKLVLVQLLYEPYVHLAKTNEPISDGGEILMQEIAL
jgi:hypothetical protein